MHVCGVDEAGRGPVIGPLVMAAVSVQENQQIPAGVTDSKKLSAKKREALYQQLIQLPHKIVVIPAREVDKAVHQQGLNWLEADHTAQLLTQLAPDKAILDCPSRNLQAYAEYVRERTTNVSVHAQFKADEEHAVVAAASILAKVIRDQEVARLREQAGFDFGSGYLTDPKTQVFLHEHFNKDFVGWRRSWKPYKQRLAQENQQKLL